MALPVIYNGEVIAIFSFFDVKPFRQDQIQNELLKRIGTQLGASIEKTRAEDELYNFFHLSADMLCVAGMDGFFKKINPAFSVVLGYTEDELLEKPFFQFLHPEDLEETRNKIHQLIKGEPLWFFENRFITKSGEIKWLEWTGTPIVEENIMFAIAKDITQKKKFESERKQILDSISDNFYALDKNFNFTYLNAAAEKLLNGHGGSLIGKNIWETFPILKGEEFYANAQLSVNSRKPIHFEYHSSIVNCWFEENFYPTEDGLSVFFKSIDERKHAEARMKEMNLELEKKATELSSINAELERFAYVASHDLQEPLRMVNGFLQLLHKKHAEQLNEDAKSYIDFAIDGSNRMKNLISDLLQYSRAGGMNMELEDVSMNKVVEDVQLLLKAAIQEKNAKIDIGNLPDIVANKTAITQLLQNLIGNALKYQPDKQIPHIQIKADQTHAGWLFSVADNGLGIIESQREKVFEVFQRLHSKQKFTGTGIGLSICKKIVERLGGKIWVEANLPQGCLFKFVIPFVQLPKQ
jgi:PAS domain S-box-containing protein